MARGIRFKDVVNVLGLVKDVLVFFGGLFAPKRKR